MIIDVINLNWIKSFCLNKVIAYDKKNTIKNTIKYYMFKRNISRKWK